MTAETRINIDAICESSEFRNTEKTPGSAMGEDVEVSGTEPCHQCYIKRRTSEDKNIERDIFIRRDMEPNCHTFSHQIVSERMGTGADPTESNKPNLTNSSYTVGLDVENLGLRPQLATQSNRVHFIEKQTSMPRSVKQLSASPVESYKKASSCFSCEMLTCILSVFAVVVSLLGFVYFVYQNNVSY